MKKIGVIFFLSFISYVASGQRCLLDFFVDKINNKHSIEADYEQNDTKWIGFVHGSYGVGGTLYFDLADYAGITDEGKDGWVSCWIDLTGGVGMPVGLGCVPRKYDQNSPDALDYFFKISGNVSFTGFKVVSLDINYKLSGRELSLDGLDTENMSLEVGVGAQLNIIRIEIKRDFLVHFLNSILCPGIDVVNMADLIISGAIKDEVWNNFLKFPYRRLTPQDSENEFLIKSITAENLVVGQKGKIRITVKPKEGANYFMRVYDNTGILPPEWNWDNKVAFIPTSYDEYIKANDLFTFTFWVTPTDQKSDFSFWLYQEKKDGDHIIEKVQNETAIFALPEGSDVIGPSVISDNYDSDNNFFNITFNEPLNQNTINKSTLTLLGSNSNEIDYSIQVLNDSQYNLSLTNDYCGANISLIASSYIQDKNGNFLDQNNDKIFGPDFIQSYSLAPCQETKFLTGTTLSPSVISGGNIDFLAKFQDTWQQQPGDVKVYIDGTSYSMTKNPNQNDFYEGVDYTFSKSFDDIGNHSYRFVAYDNDENVTAEYPEDRSTLPFTVIDNSDGWDIGVTELNASPSYMNSSGDVVLTAKIHNNSDSPDKTYSNVLYTFQLLDPYGKLIGDSKDYIASLEQQNTTKISTTLQTQNTLGNYAANVIISPVKDQNNANNTQNKTIVVGTTSPTHQYIVQSNDEDVYLSKATSLSHDGYTLAILKDQYVEINYNGHQYRVNNKDFKEIEGSTKVIICVGVDNLSNGAAFSFGTSSFDYVNFNKTTITCNSGDKITYIATCKDDYFAKSDVTIYRNDKVNDNNWGIELSGDRSTAYISYAVPNSLPIGRYDFYVDCALKNGSYLRKLTINVIAPPPKINSLSQNNFSAGDNISIYGNDFGISGKVTFDGLEANLVSYNNNCITCIVPENVEDGTILVVNEAGPSNVFPYKVSIQSSDPTANYEIPDVSIYPGETKYIADLNSLFSDPTNSGLTFYVEIQDPLLGYNKDKLENDHILELTASDDIKNNSIVKVTATNTNNKSATAEFNVSIPDFIKVADDIVNVESSGGNITVTVHSNVDWQFDAGNSWASLKKTDAGDLAITYQPNSSVVSRYVAIRLFYNDIEENFVLVQAGAQPRLSAEETEVALLSSGGTRNVNVNTNLDYWTVNTDQDWLFPLKSGNVLEIDYNSWNQTEAREANITLHGGGIESVIHIVQNGNDCMASSDPTLLNFSSRDIPKDVTLNVNSPWTISNVPDWISVDPTSGDGSTNSVVTVTVNDNQTDAKRDASLILNTDCDETSEITIKQGIKCFLYPEQSDFSLDYRQQSISLAITSNSSWSIENDNNWIQFDQSSGINSDEIVIGITENTTGESRDGTIYLNGCGDPVSIHIQQKKKSLPTITITEPTNNETLSGIGNIGFQVNDEDGVKQADVYIDDDLLFSKSESVTNLTLNEEWDTKGYTNGAHTLVVHAVDNSGLSNEKTVNVNLSNNTSSLESGIVSPTAIQTNTTAKFSVVYKDLNNLPPNEVKVIINGTAYQMNKSLIQSNFTSGVEYHLNKTFSNAGEYSYHFEAKDNNGNAFSPYPENGDLSFIVTQNNEGWDIIADDLLASPSYMTTGQTISVTGKVHNNSNTPDKIYSNVPCNFKLLSPDGTVIIDKNVYETINQGEIVSAVTTVTVPNVKASFNLVFTIYPDLDQDLSDNSLSLPIIVGQPGPSHQYLVDQNDAWIQMNASNPSYLFDDKTYELTYINSDHIQISQDGATAETINRTDFTEFSNSNYALILEAINNIGSLDAFVSFGIQNTDYVTFDETNVTGYPGDKISFTGHCEASTFGNSDPYFYKNATVESWYNYFVRSDNNNTITYTFKIPNSADPGEYDFWFATALGNDAKFLRELKVTVIPSPPFLDSPKGDSLSADGQIVITGTNLGTSGTLKFGNTVCSNILDWNPISITCVVPVGIEDGMITVVNSVGSGNGLPYYVYSSDGKPIRTNSLPDQVLNPGETKYVAYLRNFFWDPNYGPLTFSSTSTNANIVVDQQKLDQDTLKLIGSNDLSGGGTIEIKATDLTGKFITDAFQVSVPAFLKVTPLAKTVNAASGSFNANISTNTNWDFTKSSSWITVNKGDNTLQISYDTNNTTTGRSSSIRIYGSGVGDQFITVSQAGIDPYLNISPQTNNVSSGSGSKSISINSNISWSATSNDAWLTYTKTDNSLLVDFSANPIAESRTGVITIKGNGIPEKTVSIIQEGEPLFLNANALQKEVNEETGFVTFSISTNTSWQPVTNTTDWISAIKSNNSLLTVNYAKNNGVAQRTGEIVLQGTGVPGVTLKLVQSGAQPFLYLGSNSKDVSAAAGSLSIAISSNENWEIQSSSNWLTTEKLNNSSFIIYYQKNSSTNPRSSDIIIESDNFSKKITVIQQGADPYFITNPNEVSISSSSGKIWISINSNINWEFSTTDSWISASKLGNNLLQLEFQQNNSTNERMGEVVFNGQNINSDTLQIKQDGELPYLIVDPTYNKVNASVDSLYINVSSNTDWQVDDNSDWIRSEKMDSNTIKIVHDKNLDISSRAANVYIKSDSYGEVKAYMYQEGAEPSLIVEPDIVNLNSSAGDSTISVFSNVDWYEYSDVDWIQLEKADNSSFVLYYDANDQPDTRSTEVTISSLVGSVKTIDVEQNGTNSTGIAEDELVNKIYPNPVSDWLNVYFSKNIGSEVVEIYDIMGAKLIERNVDSNHIQIDCSRLKSGVYLLRLNNNYNISKTYKFIKR